MSIRRPFCLIPIFFASLALGQTTQPETLPTTEPTYTADQSTPRGAIKTWFIADAYGDGELYRNVIVGDNDAERRMIFAMAGQKDADRRLTEAMKEKFPDQAHDPRAVVNAGLAVALAKIDEATETINGDVAIVQRAGPNTHPVNLRKVHGQWCIPLQVLLGPTSPALLDRRRMIIDAQIHAMEDGIVDVKAGKYVSLNEAIDTIKNQVLEAGLKAQTQPDQTP